MSSDIQPDKRYGLPETAGPGQAYYYSRPAHEKHLVVPPGYDIDAIRAVNAERSRGWDIANKKDEDPRSSGGWKSVTSAFGGQPYLRRMDGSHNSREDETLKKPGGDPKAGPPASPLHLRKSENKSWVSDNEGHPEQHRITPCTFANWAAGCKPANEPENQAPVVPSKSSRPSTPAGDSEARALP